MSGISWDKEKDMPPLSEESLIQYATYCHQSLQIKCSTIKLYICGIRHKFLQAGTSNLFSNCCSSKLHRLELIYKGIKKSENPSTRERLPITYSILSDIYYLLKRNFFSPYVSQLIETASIVAYIGFLRCGEFTVTNEFDQSSNLCYEDLSLTEEYANLHLKSSKTDPFRHGVDIPLFKNSSPLCPVYSLRNYINSRRDKFNSIIGSEPLFIMEDGKALTRSFFISHIKTLLQSLGYDPNKYNGHSFRIGAATSVATKINDHLIQTLGRWNSSCYTRYIHTSQSTIKKAQFALITND